MTQFRIRNIGRILLKSKEFNSLEDLSKRFLITRRTKKVSSNEGVLRIRIKLGTSLLKKIHSAQRI